jgi:hypothetical protein
LLATVFKQVAPRWLHLKVLRKIQNSSTLNYNMIAFRACIASRMNRILNEDATCTVGDQQELTSA